MLPGKLGLADIILALDKGTPIVLGLIITDAFFRPDGNGLVPKRDPDPERGGHAVLAVGYGHDPKGQPAILIRNSWGSGWGLAGHAWLSSAYLARQLHETATLT
ncbi:MAG: C1 family peptidase [Methylobacterium radiotolerans]